jgi:hypothetical protein
VLSVRLTSTPGAAGTARIFPARLVYGPSDRTVMG